MAHIHNNKKKQLLRFLCIALMCMHVKVWSKYSEKSGPDKMYDGNGVVKLIKPHGAEAIFSGTEILNKNSTTNYLIGDPEERRKNPRKKYKKERKFKMLQKAQQAMAVPSYNLKALLSLHSSWDSSSGFSNTTIILNHWKRESLQAQLAAILSQSVQPAFIWVCVFDSPNFERIRKVVEEYQQHFKPGVLTLTYSDFNFKYYGRFQLALQAWTDYVWIIDDDIIPGPKMLAILTHTLNVPDLRAGVLGTIGWVMPPLNEKDRRFEPYRSIATKGGMYFEDPNYGIHVDRLISADLICSHWFLRADHVRLLFRDKWVTYETAEDYMLSYSLRRYANLESYVLPSIQSDPSTWGNLDATHVLSSTESTTKGHMIQVRKQIWQELVQRGGKYHWLLFRNFMRQQPSFVEDQNKALHRMLDTEDILLIPPKFSVAIFMDGIDDAESLADLHHTLGSVSITGGAQELLTIITGGVRGECKTLAERLPLFKGKEEQYCMGTDFGVFDMNFGMAYDQRLTPSIMFLDSHFVLNEMIDALGSGNLISLFIELEQEEKTQENFRSTLRDSLQEVLEHRNIQHLRLRPHELPHSFTLAMLAPDVLAEWRVPSFTLIVLHLEGGAETLQSTLNILGKALFFGDPIDLVLVIGILEVERCRDALQAFEWRHGHSSIKYLSRDIHFSEAVFEAHLPLKMQDNYIMVVNTKFPLDPMFYIWAKLEALALAFQKVPSSAKVMMCLTTDCLAPYHVFSAESWMFALTKCSELLEKGKDCSMAFMKHDSIKVPPFDLVVRSSDSTESNTLNVNSKTGIDLLVPDLITKFKSNDIQKMKT